MARGNVRWIKIDPRVEEVKIFMTGEESSKEFVPEGYSSRVVAAMQYEGNGDELIQHTW